MKTVLILGAGFAGLELATMLSDEVPDEVDVTIVDSSDAFVFGFSKLDLMFGRKDLAGVRVPYAHLDKPSVRFVQETILSIDPERRRVTTNAATYEPDILVVALGADLDPAATPGMVEEGSEFYTVEGAARVSELLPAFEGGDVIIGVLGNFFKCPAAPFETAFMLHDFLEKRGLQGDVDHQDRQPHGDAHPHLARSLGRHSGGGGRAGHRVVPAVEGHRARSRDQSGHPGGRSDDALRPLPRHPGAPGSPGGRGLGPGRGRVDPRRPPDLRHEVRERLRGG